MATTMTGAERRQRRIAFLVRRDGPNCKYCGCDLDEETVTLDHVIPRARGGTDGLWNLVLACTACNQAKADMLVEDFLVVLRTKGCEKPRMPRKGGCRVCKNGRRIPDNDDECWACLRPNLRRKLPARMCHHVQTWCVACA